MMWTPPTPELAGSSETSATFAIEVTARAPALPAPEHRHDSRARFLRRETVLAPDRNLAFDQRRQRSRMQHLRARVGQFRRFAVSDLAEDLRVRHQARIGRHDPVHVGPDPELGGIAARRRESKPKNPNRRGPAWWAGHRPSRR